MRESSRRTVISQKLATIASIGILGGCLSPQTSGPNSGNKSKDDLETNNQESKTLWLQVKNDTGETATLGIEITPDNERDAVEAINMSLKQDAEESHETNVTSGRGYEVFVDVTDGPKQSIHADPGDSLEILIHDDQIEYFRSTP